MSEWLGVLTATLITLLVFSRVWRLNLGFRAVERLLLGALAGYIAAVALRDVLIPGLFAPLRHPLLAGPGALVSLMLVVFLAFRFSHNEPLRSLGLLPLGLLVGGGGALALAGALRGTLVTQLLAPATLEYIPQAYGLDFLAVAAATFSTLAVLLALARRDGRSNADIFRRPFLHLLSELGYLILMVGLGALLATTAGARITLLIDRVQFLFDIWQGVL
ncbi:MAG: hypothetical protein GXP42_09825 [Chloroflexi bacterium]|nr:hypothetical protein [Chloroflexota bacterium]